MIIFSDTATHYTEDYGSFTIFVAENTVDKSEHVVLFRKPPTNDVVIPCRVSSECLPGMALFSRDCDCKEQAEIALNYINQKGYGVFILLRQEGRGHGLKIKIQALKNKNDGLDTFSAVEKLGLDPDVRRYDDAVHILKKLELGSVELMTSNPDKVEQIIAGGIRIERVTPIEAKNVAHIKHHLKAKKDRGFFEQVSMG